jgi:wyosine [tRNA(Phe)-imidazoG37] synthetase (radical SAM superfamily)
VLTNSALFTDPGVRAALMRADLVVPSLDAVSEEVFVKINRPSPGITAGQVLEGLLDFAREYTGEVWLEIFIVPGVNDTEKELRLLKDAVIAIEPDRVQVNTLDRPGAEDWVRPASPEAIERIAATLGGNAGAIGVAYAGRTLPPVTREIRETILATIRRRPCTPRDLATLLGIRPTEVAKHLRVLETEGLIEAVEEKRGVFYRPT